MPLADYNAIVECWSEARKRTARLMASLMAEVLNASVPQVKMGGAMWVAEDFLPRERLSEEEIWARIDRAFPAEYSAACEQKN